MQFNADPPGEDRGHAKSGRQRAKSALETELNHALDRLDHQVENTKNYLASLDKQTDPALIRKRRKGDTKPNSGPDR